MPAFFFDGEQAQSLINNSGQDGMKKAVEVLFGTRVIDEASESIRDYITKMSSKIGGKRSNDQQQIELDSKVQERDRAQAELVNKSKHQEELQARHRDLSNRRQGLLNEVRTRGGDRREEIETLHADRIKADNQLEIAVKQIDDVWLKMGVGLALSRYVGALRDRLAAEDAREKWEVVRDTTNRRIDEIVETAAPSPRESDDVLHALTDGNWQRLRSRIRSAIESIHNPPPIGCSESYRHGHAMGDARNRLLRLLDTVRGGNTHEIKRLARNVVDAREQLEEVRRREERNKDLPAELNTLHEQIKAVQDEIDETGRELGAVDKELSVLREQIGEFNVRIGQLQEAVAKARPQQRRLAVAERVRKVLDDLSERLQPITIRRLEDSISQHFTRIADSRYKNGRVSFAGKGTPTLAVPGRPDSLIEMMSGFERRAFGIAFSLALAEITRKRIPLVIDTPLGNADGQYRRRLLRALMDVDLDQVIILTHDAEVTGDLFEEIETKVKQTFLVEYDQRRQESIVRADSYFGGVGR
jgi:DNA sulfur modification protein DndD